MSAGTRQGAAVSSADDETNMSRQKCLIEILTSPVLQQQKTAWRCCVVIMQSIGQMGLWECLMHMLGQRTAFRAFHNTAKEQRLEEEEEPEEEQEERADRGEKEKMGKRRGKEST